MSKPRKAQLPKVIPDALGAQSASADGGGRALAAAKVERARQLIGEGAQLLAAKRPGEAIPKLQEALTLDPHNVSAAINLGGAFILQGKHDRAVPALELASRLEPDNAMIWSNLAAAYLGKLPFSTPTHQDRAIVAYEQALAVDPRAPNVHYNLGLIYLERNDVARAAAHFHRALETDPNDRDAQLWLERMPRAQDPARPDNPLDG